jgi:uncharacterized protein
MLKFRVKDIPPEGREREEPIDSAWFAATLGDVEGAWDRASGSVPLRLSRQGPEVLVRGVIHAHVTMPCARCLEPAGVDIEAEFATTFVPASASAEAEDDAPDIQHYAGDEIDLTDLVREQVLLGIPISALCRPDCRGLCPQCGQDRSAQACGCDAPPDPRSDVFKRLRPD